MRTILILTQEDNQMKQGIHPAYGEVAFRDRSTGSIRVMDSEGRVQAFRRRYGGAS
jgi:ribosomal protein L31